MHCIFQWRYQISRDEEEEEDKKDFLVSLPLSAEFAFPYTARAETSDKSFCFIFF